MYRRHKGQLVCGTLSGKPVVAMEGRHHFYEGYSLQQVTFPVRAAKALGAKVLIVSNACGGMNPQWGKGDLMQIEDHINLLGDNPLIGPNDDRLGDRFPDMCHAYDRELLKLGKRIALEEKIVCHQGVFVAVSSPNLETAAEYRFLRDRRRRRRHVDGAGGDRRGAFAHAVLGISVITDVCLPDALEPVSLPDIVKTAMGAEGKLRTLVRRVVAEL